MAGKWEVQEHETPFVVLVIMFMMLILVFLVITSDTN